MKLLWKRLLKKLLWKFRLAEARDQNRETRYNYLRSFRDADTKLRYRILKRTEKRLINLANGYPPFLATKCKQFVKHSRLQPCFPFLTIEQLEETQGIKQPKD